MKATTNMALLIGALSLVPIWIWTESSSKDAEAQFPLEQHTNKTLSRRIGTPPETGAIKFAGDFSKFQESHPIPKYVHVNAEPAASIELPFEKKLMKGYQLPEGEMEDIMMGNALWMSNSINEYEDQADADQEARALGHIFALAAERALSQVGTGARLNGITCGIRICIGMLNGGTEREYSDWAMAYAQSPELIGLGLQTRVVPTSDRSSIFRFAFTVKPYLYARDRDNHD
jgi:hypothetical protein